MRVFHALGGLLVALVTVTATKSPTRLTFGTRARQVRPLLQLDLQKLPQKSAAAPPLAPLAATLAVPLIWGTYSPLVKLVYSNADILAPPPVLFNFMTYAVAFLCLNVANAVQTLLSTGGVREGKLDPGASVFATPKELWSGAELGLWLFAGSTVQIMGIQSTTASRAAILVQLTTILVPLLDTISSGRAVPLRLWTACTLALVGVCLVTVQPTTLDSAVGPYLSQLFTIGLPTQGDLLVMLAACFYSMHVVRLGRVMSSASSSSSSSSSSVTASVDDMTVSPIRLARIKSLTELAACSATVVLLFLFSPARWAEMGSFSSSVLEGSAPGVGLVALAVLWNGSTATALTNSLQAFGQRAISPTEANLLYTTQSLWAALFSYALLGDSLAPVNILGLAVLAVAVITSLPNKSSGDEQE